MIEKSNTVCQKKERKDETERISTRTMNAKSRRKSLCVWRYMCVCEWDMSVNKVAYIEEVYNTRENSFPNGIWRVSSVNFVSSRRLNECHFTICMIIITYFRFLISSVTAETRPFIAMQCEDTVHIYLFVSVCCCWWLEKRIEHAKKDHKRQKEIEMITICAKSGTLSIVVVTRPLTPLLLSISLSHKCFYVELFYFFRSQFGTKQKIMSESWKCFQGGNDKSANVCVCVWVRE